MRFEADSDSVRYLKHYNRHYEDIFEGMSQRTDGQEVSLTTVGLQLLRPRAPGRITRTITAAIARYRTRQLSLVKVLYFRQRRTETRGGLIFPSMVIGHRILVPRVPQR